MNLNNNTYNKNCFFPFCITHNNHFKKHMKDSSSQLKYKLINIANNTTKNSNNTNKDDENNKLKRIIQEIYNKTINNNLKSIYLCSIHDSTIREFLEVIDYFEEYKNNEENIYKQGIKNKQEEEKAIKILSKLYKISKTERNYIKSFYKITGINLLEALVKIVSEAIYNNKNFSNIEVLILMVLSNIMKEQDIFKQLLSLVYNNQEFNDEVIFNIVVENFLNKEYTHINFNNNNIKNNNNDIITDKDMYVQAMHFNYTSLIITKLLTSIISKKDRKLNNTSIVKKNNFLISNNNNNMNEDINNSDSKDAEFTILLEKITEYYIYSINNIIDLIMKNKSNDDDINNEKQAIYKSFYIMNLESSYSFLFQIFSLKNENKLIIIEFVLNNSNLTLLENLLKQNQINNKTIIDTFLLLIHEILLFIKEKDSYFIEKYREEIVRIKMIMDNSDIKYSVIQENIVPYFKENLEYFIKLLQFKK